MATEHQHQTVYVALRNLRAAGLVTSSDELNRAWFTLTREFLRAPRTRIYPTSPKRPKNTRRTA